MLKIEGRLGEDYEAHRTNPENGVASQEVFPALALAVPPPFFWDGAIPPGVREQFAPNHLFVPPIQVDRFDDAIVAGAGLVFTRNGRFLHGHVPVGGGESQFLAPWTELNLQPTCERDTFSSAAVRESLGRT